MEAPNSWETTRAQVMEVLESLPPNSPDRLKFIQALMRGCNEAGLINLNFDLAEEVVGVMRLQEKEKLVEEAKIKADEKRALQIHRQQQVDSEMGKKKKNPDVKKQVKRVRFFDDKTEDKIVVKGASATPTQAPISSCASVICGKKCSKPVWVDTLEKLLVDLVEMEGGDLLCKPEEMVKKLRLKPKNKSKSKSEPKSQPKPKPKLDSDSQPILYLKSSSILKPNLSESPTLKENEAESDDELESGSSEESDAEVAHHSINSIQRKLSAQLYPGPLEFNDDMNLLFAHFEPFLTECERKLIDSVKEMYHITIMEFIGEFQANL